MRVKVLRFGFAVLLVALILYAATWAVRDCPAGELVYENCLWMAVRDYLGLAQSKLGRAVTLEIVGLALLAGLYATVRHVFPPLRAAGPAQVEGNLRPQGESDARGGASKDSAAPDAESPPG